MEVDKDQLRTVVQADPLTTTRDVVEELSVDHSMVIQHLKQIGKVKKLSKWMSHVLTKNTHKKQQQKKPTSFWSILFSYSMQQQRTISRLDCDMWWKVDFIQQPVMTTSVTGPSKSSKALPKAKLSPKKGHGHCLVVSCPLDPLQLSDPGETITSENDWKLQGLLPALVNRKGPILPHDNAQL